jgi:hypothetical protein
MVPFENLLGKRVLAFRGYKSRVVKLEFILLDDGKTYLQFEEQDQYSYHDCSPSARQVYVYEDAECWQRLFKMEGDYREPKVVGSDPF